MPLDSINLPLVMTMPRDTGVMSLRWFTALLRPTALFNHKQATVEFMTCRAYYDSNNLPEAKRTLLQAIHVEPLNQRLRFNLALVMQACFAHFSSASSGSAGLKSTVCWTFDTLWRPWLRG